MVIAGKTDKGKIREINEDTYCINKISDFLAYAIVCDGMGGSAGGEIASEKAVKIISEKFNNGLVEGIKNNTIHYMLESSILTANKVVFDCAKNNSILKGMGTTVVMAVINNNTLHIAHAGDSRAYLFRQGELHRLTVDHTVVQSLVDHGELTEDQAKNHPDKNIITRALGVSEDILFDQSEVYLQSKDILLLCTDGLSNYVDANQIKEILLEGVETAPSKLINLANKAGGKDNITAVTMLI